MRQWQKMWEFKTPQFVVVAEITNDDDLDLSWDDDGDAREGLASGRYEAFGTRVRVQKNGHTIGEDSLWGSIYASTADFFKEHFGSRPGGWGSYFPGMVREAVREARKTLA